MYDCILYFANDIQKILLSDLKFFMISFGNIPTIVIANYQGHLYLLEKQA